MKSRAKNYHLNYYYVCKYLSSVRISYHSEVWYDRITLTETSSDKMTKTVLKIYANRFNNILNKKLMPPTATQKLYI